MKIVVLGCGYLGLNIVNYLKKISQSNEITVIGMKNEYSEELNKNILFIPLEIDNISNEILEKYFKDSYVLDLLGNIMPINKIDCLENELSKVYISKFRLLEKMNQYPPKLYIFFSSGGTIYGNENGLISENHKTEPINVYGLQKLFFENLIRINYLENKKFNYINLRLANPYGGYSSKNKNQGIIDVTLRKIYNNEEIELWSDVKTLRDYIYIEDLAKILQNIFLRDIKNITLNVGSGKGCSLEEIFEKIENTTSKKIKIIKKVIPNNTIKTNILDISLLKKIIDFKNFTDFKKGILETIKINGYKN